MALNVYQVESEAAVLKWSESGNKGNQWIEGEVDLELSADSRIFFEAVRGNDYRSDVAVDDISFHVGCCGGRATCSASGDPHYNTFDTRVHHFMGTCTYLLSKLCSEASGLPYFSVSTTNEHRGTNAKVSWINSVHVFVYNNTISIMKSHKVLLNGERVNLPVSVMDLLVVRMSGAYVSLETDFGLLVRFDGIHHVDVSVPSTYSGLLCGICGNYNGDRNDDIMMPNGSLAADSNMLGESWQVYNGETERMKAGSQEKIALSVVHAWAKTSLSVQHGSVECMRNVKDGMESSAVRWQLDGVRARTPIPGHVKGINIITNGIYTMVETDFGMSVKFDGSRNLEISLPNSYYSKVCGLCGDYNGQQVDEFRMPNGHIAPSANHFGNSWQSKEFGSQGCLPRNQQQVDVLCTPREKLMFESQCQELLSNKYKSCHPLVNPDLFIKNCVQDMCKYNGLLPALCDNIQHYADAWFSKCTAGGNPYYLAFDGLVHHFAGENRYTLAETFGVPDRLQEFRILGKNAPQKEKKETAHLQEIIIEVYGHTVHFEDKQKLVVDGELVKPPIQPHDGLRIYQSSNRLRLETDFGLAVSFHEKAYSDYNYNNIFEQFLHESRQWWDYLVGLMAIKRRASSCEEARPSCSHEPLPCNTMGHKRHKKSYAHCKRKRVRYLEPDEQEILSRLCCNYDPHKFTRAEWTINLQGYAPGERRPGNCSTACKHSRMTMNM
ncbi:zonadhesin-like [Pristis pectinata]|uniref:zonadhesin-like n=1 Tax=Pristis pectinata TaxID=685728 RepID=UPI00223E1AC3|nr:zonadhesin-like [Pristis pectinata]